MVRIKAQNLEKTFGVQAILHGVGFEIGDGERVGLVGRNGQGKSTLLNIVAGMDQPDAGRVETNGRVGYLPQTTSDFDGTLAMYLSQGEQPAYRVERAAARVGIRKTILASSFHLLSEGEKIKAVLAQLLLEDPEVLLLDEPTSHLDVKALQWLEEFLLTFPGTVLVVSHDRWFLDRVVNRVMELEDGKLTMYTGNYSFYAGEKRLMVEKQQAEYLAYVAEKQRLEKAVRDKMTQANRTAKKRRPRDSFQARNRKDFYAAKSKKVAHQAKTLLTRISKLEPKEKPRPVLDINLSLEPSAPAMSRFIVDVREISKSYGGRLLFKDLSFWMEKGERVALVGENGVGKTTLVRVILGGETPDDGVIRIAPSVKTGYLDQRLETLNQELTLLEEVTRKTGRNAHEVRNVLGSLLFRGDDSYKKVAVLSQGERVRLALASLVLSDCNMLVLDEPTNSLDLASREAVENALQGYSGSLLFISHDRYFVDRIATRVLELSSGSLYAVVPYAGHKPTRGTSADDCADQLLLLETQLAEVSAQLASSAGTDQEGILNERFMELARRIARLKNTE